MLDTGSLVFVEVKGPDFCKVRKEMSDCLFFLCYPGVYATLSSEDKISYGTVKV